MKNADVDDLRTSGGEADAVSLFVDVLEGRGVAKNEKRTRPPWALSFPPSGEKGWG